ncbi:MAG: 2-phospho-L-lactate guanylyltransferase [Chloroflexota bacterium]|nr:2-phospho-L-lactate guanylyltransferase [Chloroflexota bacterium]
MITAVIPVKRLTEGKSRLAARLSPIDRAELITDLVRRAVDALHESGIVERIALATPEVALAHSLKVEALPDGGSLNAALCGAVDWATEMGATGLLILPGDLPLLGVEDVRAIAAALPDPPAISIAPTRDGGTGALLLSPPTVIPPSFGPASFERHLQLAHDCGVRVSSVMRTALSFELDTVEDLDMFAEFGQRV